MLRRFLVLGALAMAVAAPAFAQGRPAPPRERPERAEEKDETRPAAGQRVEIQILVVHATNSESGVDPRLQSLSSSFGYLKYKGYRLLSTQKAEIAAGDDASFAIEGGRRVKVTLISKDDARARVRVELSNDGGKQLDTTVSINRDGTFIVAGPKYKDGMLILPLRARY